jgi:hypothetical protein
MLSNGKQDVAQVHQSGTIQLQRFNRGAAGGRQSDNPRTILIPSEMIIPLLLSRVEQRGRLAGARIDSRLFVILVIVASLAGQREIIEAGFAARAFRFDVFNGEGLRRKTLLAAAIFTATTRTFHDASLIGG